MKSCNETETFNLEVLDEPDDPMDPLSENIHEPNSSEDELEQIKTERIYPKQNMKTKNEISEPSSSGLSFSSKKKKTDSSELERKLITAINIMIEKKMSENSRMSSSDEAFMRYVKESLLELPKVKREKAKLEIMHVFYKILQEDS